MKTPQKIKKAMVFGVFDGLHDGHRFFLTQAKDRCEKLIVVVAQDEIVRLLKNHFPKNPLSVRLAKIRKLDSKLEVVAGDNESGSWNILKKYQPDLVLVGYDQEPLVEELKKMNISFIFLSSHQPEKYKTSLLS